MKPERPRTYIPVGIKLLASYVLLTLVPLAVLGYVANAIMAESARSQTESSIRGTLGQVESNIHYRVNDINRLTDMLYHDTTLATSIRHAEAGYVSYEATRKVLLPKLRAVMEAADPSRRMRITAFVKNPNIPEVYYRDDAEEDVIARKGRYYELAQFSRIEHEAWYASLPKENYGVTAVWIQVGDDVRFGRISLIRRLVDTSDARGLKEIGVLRITIYIRDLFESIETDLHIPGGNNVYIQNDKGRVLYSPKDLPLQTGPPPDKEQNLVIRESLPIPGYRMVAVIPNEVLQADARKITWITLLVCGISIIVISAVALAVTRAFTKRMYKVLSVLRAFSRGDYRMRVQYRGLDEFAQIADSLNALGAKTDNLIQEVYLTNLRKKEAELDSLQAQINPHFLYNTLSSISRLAKFGEVDKQHRMIMNLAKFYRMSLNDGKTIIAAGNELEQIQAYLAIQQVKYGHRVSVSYDWDPLVNDYRIIKLLLQPFVENALEHAWNGDQIAITIGASLRSGANPLLEFRIGDDGIGMAPELVRELFADRQQTRRGYGIRNVHERIQLYYGRSYGVSIESGTDGGGTLVRLHIPARKGLEDESAPGEKGMEKQSRA